MAVDIRNFGHSPALKVSATESQILVGMASDVRQRVVAWTPEYPIASGALMVGDVNTVHTPEGPTINEDQNRMVSTGEWEIYVVGAVKYEDPLGPSSGAPYETTYCFRYGPTGLPFAGCDIKPIVMH